MCDDLYAAGRGDGSPLAVSNTGSIGEALIATGLQNDDEAIIRSA